MAEIEYCWSWNEEAFYDRGYPTEQACIDEALARRDCEGRTLYIGKKSPPRQPETFYTDNQVESFFDLVSEQDDYGGDWADSWERSSREQRRELAAEIRTVMAAWFDRHNVRPLFFVVSEVAEFTIVDGKAELAAVRGNI